MESVLTLSDAKARFSEVVEKAANGEVFVVTRMGKPVVRIARFVPHGQSRKLGDFAGRIRMSDDFDDWPPDLQVALGMADEPRPEALASGPSTRTPSQDKDPR